MQCDIPYAADALYGAKLAYSYVPYQRSGSMYTECEALKQGTVFPSLDKPLNVYGLEFCNRRCEEDDD
ncbi:MAG: spore coat associated protein CotJA [Clostridia bacterium]|nr:spore coat associated protein CotJA [Clostridia bacterium]